MDDLHHIQEQDDPTTPDTEFVRVNFGGAKVYGVELNPGYGVGGVWQVQGALVKQRSRFDEAEPDFGSRDFFRTPRRYGTASFNCTSSFRFFSLVGLGECPRVSVLFRRF